MLILGVLQNFRRFDANFYVFFAIYSEAESRLVRQNYTLVEQKAILLILISIIDKNINFSSK